VDGLRKGGGDEDEVEEGGQYKAEGRSLAFSALFLGLSPSKGSYFFSSSLSELSRPYFLFLYK